MRLLCSVFATCLIAVAQGPRYTDAGELIRPDNYREWVWMSSGLGMTYGPAAAMSASLQVFDNVFVDPDSWKKFKQTGAWPEGTMFVLEIRFGHSEGSINKGGAFQTDVSAVEMAVKDSAKFPEDKWVYYNFRTAGGVAAGSARVLPKSAGCFACHVTNGAVENTFSQFYPTALDIARSKGTVKASFQEWSPSPAKLYSTVAGHGWESGKAVLEKARTAEPGATILREPVLNLLGYQLLGSGKKDEALEVFRYAVMAYPESANAADSLSEALEGVGKKDEALASARRGVGLLRSAPEPRRAALQKALSERIARLEKVLAAAGSDWVYL